MVNEDVNPPGTGATRTALENSIVGLFKRLYGVGPAAAKAWILDDYVLVVLEGGLARNEETLVAAGQEEEVRRFRLVFQQAVAVEARQSVAQIMGRTVVAYHSQIIFRPTRSFEIFILEGERSA